MEIISWLFGKGGWWTFLGALLCISFYCFHGLSNNTAKRGWWVAKLKHDSFARLYRELLTSLLDRIDRALSPAPDWPDEAGLPKTEPGRAWGWRLLDLCLLLAVVYPIIGLGVDWMITGDAGRLGSFVVLQGESEKWRRLLPIALFAGAVLTAIFALRIDSMRVRPILLLVALGLVHASTSWVPFVDVNFPVVGAFEGEESFPLAVAFAALFVGVFAIVLVGATPFALAVVYFGAFENAAVGYIAIAGALAQEWLCRKTGCRREVLIGYAFLVLFALGTASRFNAQQIGNEERGLLLFFGFLPLLNGLFDYLSAGLTRWRLRCGIQGHLIRNAVIDALAGYAILLMLAFAIITTIRFATPTGTPPLINLTEIFTDFSEGRANEYYWLIGMLFSTLLPTLLHLCIGCLAAFTIVSRKLGRPIAAGLASGAGPAGNFATLTLIFSIALAAWVPFWLVCHLAMMGLEPVLRFTLQVCEGFARAIGAI
ncbi:hypothetical protein [Amaricoccus macauensis]|uniref:hypothetical protein n=1 Tax=Amaricoccus macauensis TaxID=57001 RepID=UPI003C7C076D